MHNIVDPQKADGGFIHRCFLESLITWENTLL